MNWEAIGASAEVIGVITILASLIYLSVQIRQNNEQMRIQSYQAWVAVNMELNVAALDPLTARIFPEGNADSSNLTNENYTAYGMWYTAFMQMAQTTDILYRAGSIDRELWECELDRTAMILSIPGVRQWWDAGGRTQCTPTFVKVIEAIEPKAIAWSFQDGRGFVPLSEAPDRT